MTTNKGKKGLILYVAPAEKVPGSVGGSVHVEEVAHGLTRLGYAVEIVCRETEIQPSFEELAESIRINRVVPRYRIPFSLWRAYFRTLKIARRINPDYIIERYYNFGGAGILTGKKLKKPVMLEVNSPVRDHPGSLKRFIDNLLLIRPMKRYREFQCSVASDIVTPLPSILPDGVDKIKVHEVNWGAAVERFERPVDISSLRQTLELPQKSLIFVFLGSFRKWHGVWDLINAAENVLGEKHSGVEPFFLMVGDGPEKRRVMRAAETRNIGRYFRFTGSIEYHKVPDYLRASDVGIAPFNPNHHPQLKLGFYWSPLKIFEYMAAGLPVITIDLKPLNSIIENEHEGLVYRHSDVKTLTEKILKIMHISKEKRANMGKKAKAKVHAEYSWKVHCDQLDRIIENRLGLR